MAISFVFVFITNEVDYFSIHLLINCIFTSLNCLFIFSAHLTDGTFLYKRKKIVSYQGKPLFPQAL